ELAAAQARSPWLTERIGREDYTLIHGNHDAILKEAGVPTEVWLGRDDPHPALLLHGDAFDPVIQQAPAVSGLATWASGRLRSVGMRPIAQWLEDRDIQIKGQCLQTPSGPYVAGARARMQADGAKLLVMGHTHIPWRYETPEGTILNSGTCCRGQKMYASLDTLTGESRSIQCT
ncbi:MAG: UDP-2,3-diacylglucosamine pyrophosphatase LpxH, partial [Myxococcota bacterium]